MNVADGYGVSINSFEQAIELLTKRIKAENLKMRDGYLIGELMQCSNLPQDWTNLKPVFYAKRYGFAGSLVGFNYFDKTETLIGVSSLTCFLS